MKSFKFHRLKCDCETFCIKLQINVRFLHFIKNENVLIIKFNTPASHTIMPFYNQHKQGRGASSGVA